MLTILPSDYFKPRLERYIIEISKDFELAKMSELVSDMEKLTIKEIIKKFSNTDISTLIQKFAEIFLQDIQNITSLPSNLIDLDFNGLIFFNSIHSGQEIDDAISAIRAINNNPASEEDIQDIRNIISNISFDESAITSAINSLRSEINQNLIGVERVENRVNLSESNSFNQYPNARSTWDTIQLAISTVPPGGLRIPIKIELESNLPNINTLTENNIGDFYFIQNMDIMKPGHSGKAWIFEENGIILINKIYDMYFSPDNETITLTPQGRLQVSNTWETKFIDEIIRNGENRNSVVWIATEDGNDNDLGNNIFNSVRTLEQADIRAGRLATGITYYIMRRKYTFSSYNANINYIIGNEVEFSGFLWRCILNTTNNAPSLNSTFWVFVNDNLNHPNTNYRGNFTPGTYNIGDIVIFNNITHICIRDIWVFGITCYPSNDLSQTAFWTPISNGNPFIRNNIEISNFASFRLFSMSTIKIIFGEDLIIRNGGICFIEAPISCGGFLDSNAMAVTNFLESVESFHLRSLNTAFYRIRRNITVNASLSLQRTGLGFLEQDIKIMTASPTMFGLNVREGSKVVLNGNLRIDGNNTGNGQNILASTNNSHGITSQEGSELLFGQENRHIDIRGFFNSIHCANNGVINIAVRRLEVHRDSPFQNISSRNGRLFFIGRGGTLKLQRNLAVIERNGMTDLIDINSTILDAWNPNYHAIMGLRNV